MRRWPRRAPRRDVVERPNIVGRDSTTSTPILRAAEPGLGAGTWVGQRTTPVTNAPRHPGRSELTPCVGLRPVTRGGDSNVGQVW
jgi:hypothetical protein